MQKQQSGFTLIELVVVIVILGILAATALPKFVDLSDDANTSAVKGIAGGLNAADAVNYATYLTRRTKTDLSVATANVVDTTGGCTATVAGNLLSTAGTLTGYTVSGTTTGTPQGTVNLCTLTQTATGKTGAFQITVAK